MGEIPLARLWKSLPSWKRRAFGAIAALVAVILVVGSEAVQNCIDDYQHHYASDQPSGIAVLGFVAGAAFRCGGRYLHENGEALTAVFTLALACVTLALWWATRELALDAREASTEAIRPWIRLEVEVGGPLAYDSSGWDAGQRWHMTANCKLKNLGKTPALNVAVFAAMVPFTLSVYPGQVVVGQPLPKLVEGTDIARLVHDICNFPEETTKYGVGWGITVFPDDSRNDEWELNGDEAVFEKAKSHPGYSGQFLLVFGVAYNSGVSKKPHRTAQAFHLFNRSNEGRIDLDGDGVPGPFLRLVKVEGSAGSQIT